VADVLQNLPAAVGNWSPSVTTGFGFSPGSASVALKGLGVCRIYREAVTGLRPGISGQRFTHLHSYPTKERCR
jgi:hypothetical protein